VGVDMQIIICSKFWAKTHFTKHLLHPSFYSISPKEKGKLLSQGSSLYELVWNSGRTRLQTHSPIRTPYKVLRYSGSFNTCLSNNWLTNLEDSLSIQNIPQYSKRFFTFLHRMLFFEKSIYIEKIFKTFLQTIQICVEAADILWYIVFHQSDDQFLNSILQ
jgi:hypothetical protein